MEREELAKLKFSDPLIIYLPLPSIGVSNSHIDICSDLIEASWAAERLAGCATTAEAEHDYLPDRYRTRVKLTLHGPGLFLRDALEDCLLVFQYDEELNNLEQDRIESLRESIFDHEEALASLSPLVPDVVDWYYANFVGGALYEISAESPEYYDEKIRRHPEYQLGFYRSAFSNRLGADVFCSPDSWIAPASLDPDQFFAVTDQSYKLDEFIPAAVFVVGGQSYAIAGSDIAHFPMNQYFKSRVCASFQAPSDDGTSPVSARFEWVNSTFTFSPHLSALRNSLPEKFRSPLPEPQENCLVHRSGSMIVLNDDFNRHFLYDTEFINESELRKLNDKLAKLSIGLAGSLGISSHMKHDWAKLDDETFELLCYDLIVLDPRFDARTINKMGKSRSRDGGRDIVVYTKTHGPDSFPKKWIFQCKLIRSGSSLSGAKLVDIGDMLDQYEAKGFGVMTSALIDATLYDKLESICKKRHIEQMHFSVLELERSLARYSALDAKYFSQK